MGRITQNEEEGMLVRLGFLRLGELTRMGAGTIMVKSVFARAKGGPVWEMSDYGSANHEERIDWNLCVGVGDGVVVRGGFCADA